jgi:hypothetical protein
MTCSKCGTQGDGVNYNGEWLCGSCYQAKVDANRRERIAEAERLAEALRRISVTNEGSTTVVFPIMTGRSTADVYSYVNEKVNIIRLEREYCIYCHGTTKTDDKGNCYGCGAPRND